MSSSNPTIVKSRKPSGDILDHLSPGEAAAEDWIEEMNRHLKLGLVSEAASVCTGIAAGLYKAGQSQGDGVLGWAPDFPAEHAQQIVGDFLRSCGNKMKEGERAKYLENVAN